MTEDITIDDCMFCKAKHVGFKRDMNKLWYCPKCLIVSGLRLKAKLPFNESRNPLP